jgi:hypothetical protein
MQDELLSVGLGFLLSVVDKRRALHIPYFESSVGPFHSPSRDIWNPFHGATH